MFENWSQTYAASITTFAPIAVIILGRFGFPIAESDFILVIGTIISAIGFVWQLYHRFTKGDINALGSRIH